VELEKTVVDARLETNSEVDPEAGPELASEVDPEAVGRTTGGRPMYRVAATMIRAASNAAEAT
jgi:hypothetical protein